jgi:signal transduction histidine kinase
MTNATPDPGAAGDSCKAKLSNALTVERLAHELSSLLDGSLRCVRLAERALDNDNAVDEQLIRRALERLRTAQSAMDEMAALLHRAMEGHMTTTAAFERECSLAEAVRQAIETVTPLADAARVGLSVDVASAAADLPAGPLGTMLINGLRNAIEACAEPGVRLRRVELTALLTHNGRELSVLICDTAGGLADADDDETEKKAGGHGIGLGVCRDLARGLGGQCELSDLPYGAGAVLQITVPLRSLKAA